MHVFCTRHNGTHHLTIGQAERAIYILSAAYADEATEPDGGRVNAGERSDDNIPCPLEVVEEWADPEMYAEHVESMVEGRRACAKAAA